MDPVYSIMAPIPNNAPYQWKEGDIIGLVLFPCFMVSIIILIIWRKARCCIPCCILFDNLQGKNATKDHLKCTRPGRWRSSYVVKEYKARRASFTTVRIAGDDRNSPRQISLPTCPGFERSPPVPSPTPHVSNRQTRAAFIGLPRKPIKAYLMHKA